jgi:hypothetical protein
VQIHNQEEVAQLHNRVVVWKTFLQIMTKMECVTMKTIAPIFTTQSSTTMIAKAEAIVVKAVVVKAVVVKAVVAKAVAVKGVEQVSFPITVQEWAVTNVDWTILPKVRDLLACNGATLCIAIQ